MTGPIHLAPRTIRARIHESAVRRVTRTYAATLAEIFAELLQNARRAGATRVGISVERADDEDTHPTAETPFAIAVADDGVGIADPAVLLSFGENGWSDDLVRREDAAGFGFASLARRGCAVSTRPRSPDGDTMPGWRVDLAPEHFLGEDEASIFANQEAPYPYGTSISFVASEVPAAVRNAAENAARHYPLPVVFHDRTGGEPGIEEELPRRAFLDGAVHAKPWRGLAFGVFRDRRHGYNDPDLNFFGLTLPVRLPAVETVHGGIWTVRADVYGLPRPGTRPAGPQGGGRERVSRGDARGRPARGLPRHGRRPGSASRFRGLETGARGRHRHRPIAGHAAALAPLGGGRQRLAGVAEARPGGRRYPRDELRSGTARGPGALARRRARRHRTAPVRGRSPSRRLPLVRRHRAGRPHPHRGDGRTPPVPARQVPRFRNGRARPRRRSPGVPTRSA